MFVFVISHCKITGVVTAKYIYKIVVRMSLAYELRDQTKIYLIGNDANQIIGSKLPSNMQVLKVLFYNLRKVKLNVRESCSLLIKETIVFWEKARIPTRDFPRCVDKLEKMYNEWRNLQKHATRKNENQINKEKQFTDQLKDLFDIAHANAMQMISLEEDKSFLTLQRQKERPGYLSGVDYAFMKKVKVKEERQEKLNARKKRHYEQCAATFNKRKFVIFFNHTFIFNKLLNRFFFYLIL